MEVCNTTVTGKTKMISTTDLLTSTPELSILANGWLAVLVASAFSVYLRIAPNFTVSHYIMSYLVIARARAEIVISKMRALFTRR